jgi:methionyl-tRNA formyltransferase
MHLNNLAILAADTCRTRIYLQALASSNMLPKHGLFLANTSDLTSKKPNKPPESFDENGLRYDLSIPVNELFNQLQIPYHTIDSGNPNDPVSSRIVKEIDEELIIYSGPGGCILRNEILTCGKNFIHVHSGILPEYRGSTTIYYSILKDGTCGATAFIMDEKIDHGPIIKRRGFPIPTDRKNLDYFYDSYIRSQLLLDVLNEFKTNGFPRKLEENNNQKGETYYKIHPILKSLAIYGKVLGSE